MWITFIAIATLALAGQPALAQIQRYDPNSGRYYTSDLFAPTTPPTPNPCRLDASRTRNVASPIGRQSGGQVPAGMGAQVGTTESASGSASGQHNIPRWAIWPCTRAVPVRAIPSPSPIGGRNSTERHAQAGFAGAERCARPNRYRASARRRCGRQQPAILPLQADRGQLPREIGAGVEPDAIGQFLDIVAD